MVVVVVVMKRVMSDIGDEDIGDCSTLSNTPLVD